MLMFYDGGERSTVTKYGTVACYQNTSKQQQEGKECPILYDHGLVLLEILRINYRVASLTILSFWAGKVRKIYAFDKNVGRKSWKLFSGV